MSVRAPKRGSFSRPSPQTSKAAQLKAPYMGIDFRTVLSEGAPLTSVYAYNLLPAEFGLRVRNGYREWCKGLEDAVTSFGIRTVVSYDGNPESGDDDRLFAITNEGIWDCSIYDLPILKITFADNTGDAGYGVYTSYITQADAEIIFYADAVNGLFQYDPATNLWTQATGITGVDPLLISYVVNHKNNIWFVERDSSVGWYLPNKSISGEATAFFMGNKFKNGGDLVGMFNWTLDGGDGVDDYLVFVSRSGDVIPFRGSGPDETDWLSVGQYFIGRVPRGNRIGSEHGGNLYLLSAYGLTSMQDLVNGVDATDAQTIGHTNAVASIIRAEMTETIDDLGWSVRLVPALGGVVISTPKRDNNPLQQYVYSTTNRAWSVTRNLPLLAFDEWNGVLYFGAEDNILFAGDVTLDNVLIDPPIQGINGEPIQFSILTTFSDFGEPAQFKRCKYIRPDFITRGNPFVEVKAVYDYNIIEPVFGATPPFDEQEFYQWDVGLWDNALWGSNKQQSYNQLGGAWGLGRTMAIAMRGESDDRTTLISWDIIWDAGGPI